MIQSFSNPGTEQLFRDEKNRRFNAIGVAPRAINEIVHAKRSITPQMSIRFGAFFGQSEDFWHGIQVECDFRALRKEAPRITQYVQTAESLMVCEE
jgi:addiction module HigA family antidote